MVNELIYTVKKGGREDLAFHGINKSSHNNKKHLKKDKRMK